MGDGRWEMGVLGGRNSGTDLLLGEVDLPSPAARVVQVLQHVLLDRLYVAGHHLLQPQPQSGHWTMTTMTHRLDTGQ